MRIEYFKKVLRKWIERDSASKSKPDFNLLLTFKDDEVKVIDV